MNKPVNIGFGNMVMPDKIVAMTTPDAAPVKRLIQEAKEAGNAVDATCGRRTRCVIFTNSKYIILSSLQPETISQRM